MCVCEQFIGQLAFVEADMLLDMDGFLVVTQCASAHIHHWMVAVQFSRCVRELRFSHKPRILADFDVFPVIVRGECVCV